MNAGGFLKAVYGGDVGMIQRSCNVSLTLNLSEPLRVTCEELWQDFDSALASQLRVTRTIDLAHAAGAEQRDKFVRPQARSRGEWHRLGPWLARREPSGL